MMAAAGLLFCTLSWISLRNFGDLPWIMAAIALVLTLTGLSLFARGDDRADRIASPLLFGLLVIWLWEMLVTGLHVPFVILPPPSRIALAIAHNLPILWADFVQTVLHAVLAGFALGCGIGFLLALAIDRSPFLQRGLTPLGNLISALPIIGIAPIMVMWFGFGWQSKAAVVVLMTVFPMLVNTRAGLASTDAMERDLMQTYAAGYWRTLLSLRLPVAMPMIFNALKLNATLALIGAVVAEFFGTPTRGMGFRISTEAARMNLDIVWATIVVAAVTGCAAFVLITLIERVVTFWHPSIRGADRR
ncbi:ABC transporter permease [Acidisoma cellulosilytica]|uniref:ABC transporter permease n=2 Tax=Acidisoma cellulosilyticum TaxID=2802395 RepID=A0A964E440_9PROT|nr:ABC transporter permease [Acidisoma cellulosilyticum]